MEALPDAEVMGVVDPVAEIKTQIKDLATRKEALELDVKAALELLEATPVGLQMRLIDEEGFPRNDVDLHAVRTARHTVATGVNDLKAIDESLHELLRQLHEATSDVAHVQMTQDDAMRAQRKREAAALQQRALLEGAMKQLAPFLLVEAVADGSPAAGAGMATGDRIVDLGGIRHEQFQREGLAGLGATVRSSEGSLLHVWVLRTVDRIGAAVPAVEVHELPLVPQRWRGDGLLGCSLAVAP